MKRIITTLAALVITAMGIQTASAKKPAGEKTKADPEAGWKKIAGDKESVTKEEFTKDAKDKAKAEAQFDKKDANKDGKLTKEEFLAAPAKTKKEK
ncbi:MAG: hypothetical protein WCK55_12915 [Verrucomicrobiota bacterium]